MMLLRNPAVRFTAIFLVCLIACSLAIRLDVIDRHVVVPLTVAITQVSSVLLSLLGMPNTPTDTVITGENGFAINILNGCNGIYVSAIVLSAILAFPSTLKEKLIGLAIGIPGIQAINLVRIITLYFIALHRPDLFEQYHIYVWQSIVIILSMGIWLFWAEALVASPARLGNGSGEARR